jgi:CBS domain-containing protein/sporulation protein YlmC with PRC-barrel domain
MPGKLLYLTELIGLKVYDLKRRRIGSIRDAAIVPVIDPARVDRFLIGGGWSWMTFRHDQVESISLDGIYLSGEQLTPYHADEYMLRLARDLSDHQIIDAHGRKVVRVTDVTFEIRNNGAREELFVTEVDVGVRAVFRRVFQGVLPRRWIRRLQRPIAPNSIDWNLTDIVEADPQRRIRLNITFKHLEEMHPADVADIVEELSPEDREAIFETIDSELAAEALTEVEPVVQASILESLEAEKAADIIEEMSPDAAADALGELEAETTAEILDEMETEPKTEVQELLEFREDTAGGMMNTEFVSLPDTATAGDALVELRQNGELLDHLSAIYLVDEGGRLTGVVPLARVMVSDASRRMREIAMEEHVDLPVSADRREVTETFDRYNLLALPVVYSDGRLAGIITADDIITVLRQR